MDEQRIKHLIQKHGRKTFQGNDWAQKAVESEFQDSLNIQHTGRQGRAIGSLATPDIIVYRFRFLVRLLGGPWGLLRSSWDFGKVPGCLLRVPWGSLGGAWGSLGGIWGSLEGPWGFLEGPWGFLKGSLGGPGGSQIFPKSLPGRIHRFGRNFDFEVDFDVNFELISRSISR